MGTILDSIKEYHAEVLRSMRPKSNASIRRQAISDMMDEIKRDTMQVFDFGAKKHPDSGRVPNFLTPEGNKCARKDRGSSCLRHAAELYIGNKVDEESNLSPALHLIASAAILYIRQKRNIVHTKDKGE